MKRTYRVLLANAYYHVISRGNQKQKVFLEDDDFEKFSSLLKRYKIKFKFRLYAWCFMPNHVHLMVDVNNPTDLAKIMHGLKLAYARWFNHKYSKVGHLWQGRFKNMLIQKDQYVLDCINYIELNPVRANIKQAPLDYKWSSFRPRTIGEKSSLLDKVNL